MIISREVSLLNHDVKLNASSISASVGKLLYQLKLKAGVADTIKIINHGAFICQLQKKISYQTFIKTALYETANK